MRKAFVVSALMLGIAGCAAPPNNAPVVRDLSASRSTQSGDTVTVQSGDTLYGIAWRNNMDFRELAQINNVSPPYRLEPGQTLRLNAGAAAGNAPQNGAAQNAQGVTVASVNGAETATANGTPDWLAPDTETIERNRRLTSRPLDGAQTTSSTASSAATQPSGEALSAAGRAGGSDAPGPIYNYGSPGADGQLSARDQAERDALAQQRSSQQASASAEVSQPTPPTPDTSDVSVADQSVSGTSANAAGAGSQAATSPSSSPGDTATNTTANGGASDAGTAVAGEASGPSREQRTFQPVEDIPWQWPADGQVVGRFGDGSNITAGIDIAGQKGQPVKAAGPGIVVYAGNGVRGYGNLILLKHNDRYLSAYAHNDSLRVKENDVVEAGEVIASMGNTDADSVKLHFEVRQDGQPQDPLKFLPQR
ncbi:peptidoglycan DD-metalloendopeptidase family protein [Halomonas sp. McH1-25]|uniref:peptidoglycan DD-metalloendopeptidase family protein n=1 Tax=unclassified Halomonas TaxID=2609666 RepID=UPI001EF6F683|nr:MULTISPECIES: peptidoglycan DD-metalloendopeptidase family protein [unclassified Halomonas]MCG7600498.1 peptidoglycan DD-metalloendopeptidase family protein [Halomonas sp. McH1-25]MCP1343558.1 peptidoglycan DD-metalloendopeptidase family protein [Halomonas sp. FL8]MCP1360005.1 peptidoglycan DD-metalloendopeptidase family protein [Halomonas sp. BBD45]